MIQQNQPTRRGFLGAAVGLAVPGAALAAVEGSANQPARVEPETLPFAVRWIDGQPGGVCIIAIGSQESQDLAHGIVAGFLWAVPHLKSRWTFRFGISFFHFDAPDLATAKGVAELQFCAWVKEIVRSLEQFVYAPDR